MRRKAGIQKKKGKASPLPLPSPLSNHIGPPGVPLSPSSPLWQAPLSTLHRGLWCWQGSNQGTQGSGGAKQNQGPGRSGRAKVAAQT